MRPVPAACALCPRRCKADRTRERGFCGGGAQVRVARAALHLWEEPCLSGTRGSGTVFFSGCTLRCCYCQNWRISAENFGRDVSVPHLADIFLRLQAQGAHNINLVTPTQYLPWILDALELAKPRLTVPIVYNTGGYETLETVRRLDGVVDVWLTDLKYVSGELSARYSGAPDYFAVASQAVRAMCEQAGPPRFDENGLLQKGVIVRHLALPGGMDDTRAVLEFLAEKLPKGGFLTSLMSQYTPFYRAKEHKVLSRRISTYEYRKAVDLAVELGLTDGYMQQRSSAKEEYTPPFDLEGVL